MATKKEQGGFLRWMNFIAFALVLFGGLNWLLIGLFQFDLFGILGGFDGFVSRIFYSSFGLGALWLLGYVLYKTLMAKPATPAVKKASA